MLDAWELTWLCDFATAKLGVAGAPVDREISHETARAQGTSARICIMLQLTAKEIQDLCT